MVPSLFLPIQPQPVARSGPRWARKGQRRLERAVDLSRFLNEHKTAEVLEHGCVDSPRRFNGSQDIFEAHRADGVPPLPEDGEESFNPSASAGYQKSHQVV